MNHHSPAEDRRGQVVGVSDYTRKARSREIIDSKKLPGTTFSRD
jgi:hypothetical protein